MHKKSLLYIVNSVAMNEALFTQKSLWIRENLNLFTNAKSHRFLPKRLDFACENLLNNCKCDHTLMLTSITDSMRVQGARWCDTMPSDANGAMVNKIKYMSIYIFLYTYINIYVCSLWDNTLNMSQCHVTFIPTNHGEAWTGPLLAFSLSFIRGVFLFILLWC